MLFDYNVSNKHTIYCNKHKSGNRRFFDENNSVMIDKGGYKKEVLELELTTGE